MVRGHAKAQAQAAAQKRMASSHQAKSQLGKAREQGLKFVCPVCKISSPAYKVLATHFESKHPKDTLPPESSFAQ